MTIVSGKIFKYEVPLTSPLPLRGQTIDRRVGLIIQLVDESGAEGYGEASPLPGFSKESVDKTSEQLVDTLRGIVGQPVPDGVECLSGGFERWLGPLKLFPAAQCGIEMAVLNLVASNRGVSLSQLLGQVVYQPLPVNGLLAGELKGIMKNAAEMALSGYAVVKLKVGRWEPEKDAALVRALDGMLGAQLAFRLDANRAWDYDTAVVFANAVRECRIEYIEEPLQDPTQLGAFIERTGMPVALDETLVDNTELLDVEMPTIAALVIKPTLLGGFESASSFIEMAEVLGAQAVVSSCFESSIGLASLAQFAFASPGPDTPAGLDTNTWFAKDVVNARVNVDGGSLYLPHVPFTQRAFLKRVVTEVCRV